MLTNAARRLFTKVLYARARKIKAENTNTRAFEHAFADSGYWDFTILINFSTFIQLFVVNTTSNITENSIVERAPYRLQMLFNATLTAFKSTPLKSYGFHAISLGFWFSVSLYIASALITQLTFFAVQWHHF